MRKYLLLAGMLSFFSPFARAQSSPYCPMDLACSWSQQQTFARPILLVGPTNASAPFGVTPTGGVLKLGDVTTVSPTREIRGTSSLDGIIYVDGSTYPWTDAGLGKALSDAASQGGGEVVVPPGATIQLTSQHIIGDGTHSVKLKTSAGSLLIISTGGNVCEFPIAGYSSFEGPLVAGDVTVRVAGNASLSHVFCPYKTDGTQQFWSINGLNLSNYAGQTPAFSGGAIYLQTTGQTSYIENSFVGGLPTKLLQVAAPRQNGNASGPFEILNDWWNCSRVPGCQPVSIEADGEKYQIGGLYFEHNQFEHSPAGVPEVQITGSTSYGYPGINTITFEHSYCENSYANDCFDIAGATNIDIDGLEEGGAAGTDMVHIENTGYNANIRIAGLFDQNGTANFVENDASGITLAKNSTLQLTSYHWSGANFRGTSTPDFFDGGIELRGGATLIPTTIANLPPPSASAGSMYFVSDSTAISTEGQTCAHTRSSPTNALAISNGSVWKCF